MKKFAFSLSIFSLSGLLACSEPETLPTASSGQAPSSATTSVTTQDVTVNSLAQKTLAQEKLSQDSQIVPSRRFVGQDAKLATLRVQFVIDGTPPKSEKVDASRDAFCAALNIVADDLIIGKDGGIQNMAIYYDSKKNEDIEIPAAAKVHQAQKIKLDNTNCLFEPKVIAARPGDTIDVFNSDQTGHNANFNFFDNDPVNFIVPIGGNKGVQIKLPERGVTEVTCNIHPWMKAHLFITDDPYVGISDENGVLEIANLPAGEIAFRVWHKIGKISDVTIGGKSETWSRGRMEFELKPGINDLGIIKVPADAFK